jgi:adenylate cyclase
MSFVEPRPTPPQRRYKWPTALLSTIAISVGMIGLQQSGLFQKFDRDWFDDMSRLRPVERLAPPITLITITEADIAQQRQWPLNDASLATLLQRIQQAQPRVVGLNIYRNIAIEPGSAQLQRTIQSMPNLIGIEKIVADERGPAIAPHPALKAQHQVAASDIVLDGDGKIRRHLISLRNPQGDIGLSLGAQLAMQYLKGQGDRASQLDPTKIPALPPSSGGYVGIDTGGYQILSHFLPLESIPRLTLQQVLAGEGRALIQDRIVIIGSTASSLQQQFYTPTTQAPGLGWSGLELQADLAGQILLAATQGRTFIQGSAPWIGWIGIAAASTIGLGLGARLGSRRQFWLGVAIGLASLLALSYGLFLLNWWTITIAPSLTYLSAIVLGRQLRSQRLILQAQDQLQDYSQSFILQLAEEVEAHARTQAQAANQLANLPANQAANLLANEQAAGQTKRDLIAFLGHELRTPLNSIVGYGQLMAAESALPEQYRTSIDTINSSSEYLLKLVNELLEFSRFESTKSPLNRNSIHLPSLLNQIESLFRLQAKKGHLRFRCTSDNTLPDYIWADEIKLRQVLINLVNNALKFTQSGHVILRAWGNGNMYFEVEDTGPGIASSELLHIFEAFRQVPEATPPVGRSAGFQGVGLGLWISESLVTLMEGKITVVSKLGEGSKFRVTLPLHPVALAPHPEPKPQSSVTLFVPKPEVAPIAALIAAQPIDASISTAKPPLYRVLVVDDVMVNRTLIVKFLEAIGVEIQEASSGEEAIERWQAWQPHLILMDLYMPGMGGCEAVRLIRKQELDSTNRPSTPILAITANAQLDTAMAIAAGYQEVLPKPIRRDELLIRVKENLMRSGD